MGRDGRHMIPTDKTDRLVNFLALSFSIPERAARAMSALVGGSTLLLTNTLIPGAVQGSSSYRFTVGMFQTFLVRNMAGIQSDDELQDRFVQRKLVGTSIEAAGLLTMRLSPVWVFAIASDAARGGQVFLQRLVNQLKENGVISPDSNPQTLEQLLESIDEMGRKGASAVDTPPLNTEEIKALADELRQSTASMTNNATNLLPTFESIWSQIESVAKKENLSVSQVMGMLSVSAASIAKTGVGTADAVGQTSYKLVDEMLLDDYRNTLQEITEVGAYAYMSEHMQPYLDNARSHFDFQQETHSQRWFKKTFYRAITRITRRN